MSSPILFCLGGIIMVKTIAEKILTGEDKTEVYYRGKTIIAPVKMIEFLNEIESICRKHNLSIAHEDNQGGFIIQEYKDGNMEWLSYAELDIKLD
jgi:hypothetical protein